MRRLSLGSFALAAALLTASCATIVKGSTQSISVNTNVPGATVLLDDVKVGVTPFTGPVKKNAKMLTVQMDGYQPVKLSLATSIEPIFFGNIITGGTLGSITDFASGAAWQYAPAAYQVDLKAAAQPTADFEHRASARKFAMIYLNEVGGDLVRGGGEHLSALLAIVNGAGPARVDAAAVRDALERSGGDPVRFGNRVVDLI